MELKDKNILVTGGRGFLGSWVVQALIKHGVPSARISISSSKIADLTKWEDCVRAVKGQEVVIHLAAVAGGIGANKARPGKFFYDNALMGMQLMEASRQAGAKKFVGIGTICEYPEIVPIPFKEETIWDGYPTPVTAPYGLAKKMLLVQGQSYEQEYGFRSVHLLPTNLYGPGDNFELERSHVIPALIRKVVEASASHAQYVESWGTGKATRDFLYVKDAAKGIVQAAERYDKTDPVNIGSGRETPIREVMDLIVKLVGFKGEVRWDSSKPDGQPRRRLDISRAEREFGFEPTTSFEQGLKETIEWYKSQ